MRRILAVEDSPTQAERLRFLLEDAGYAVEVAADGEAALERIRVRAPDLIVSDIVMPRMDGYAFCRTVKSSRETRHVPVVLLTSRRTPADIIRGLEHGADNFITKPFEDDYLLERIHRIFEHLEHRKRGRFEMEVALRVAGRELVLNADKQQIVELLFATSEELNQANEQLEQAKRVAEDYARTLEERVRERTRQLAEAEARYRTLVEQVPAVIYIADPDRIGPILYMSPQIEALLGVPPDEWTADPELWTRQTHQDDRERVHAERARLRATGHASSEYRMLARDGRWVSVRDEARMVAAAESGARVVQGVLLDITQRNRAERRLAARHAVTAVLAEAPGEAEAMPKILRALCESLEWDVAGFWEVDRSGNVLRPVAAWHSSQAAAPEFAAVTRATVFAPGVGLPGRVWVSGEPAWIPDIGRDSDFPRAAVAARENLHAALGFPIRGSSGVQGVMEFFSSEIRRPDEDVLQMLRDIGSQAGLFLERRRAEEALRESQRLVQAVVDSTPAVIYAVDAQGRLILANRGIEAILGSSRDELLGKTVADVLPPDFARRVRERELRVLDTRAPLEAEEQVPLEDGIHTYSSVKFPLFDSGGSPYAVCSIATDVTEKKQAEVQLRHQREALAQTEKLAAMSSLVAGVAHELNNPLSVIMGQTSLLRQIVEGKAAERAEKIARSAERCARIVRNFLALARQQPPERARVFLNQVVQEALELVAYPLRVDGVEVVTELAAHLPVLWADPHQLQQVVLNLVTNAHHALRGGAQPRRVKLSTRVDGETGRAVLTVADNGSGIPPEALLRIFEPFFTTKALGQGTGLGLSLCRGILETHGGTLTAENEPSGGAVFRVELPAEGKPAAAALEGPPPEPPRPIAVKSILVVDDEAEVAGVLADILSAEGHRVATAENGIRALEKVRLGRYDLIVSDIRMPELDGPGLHREVERAHPELARCFVFLTGDTLASETAEFLERTEAPSLAKPFDTEEVLRVVRKALGTA